MTDNPSEIKPLAESMKKSLSAQFGDLIEKIVKWDWIFSKLYEKIIVVGAVTWTFYSIARFVWGLFR